MNVSVTLQSKQSEKFILCTKIYLPHPDTNFRKLAPSSKCVIIKKCPLDRIKLGQNYDVYIYH